MAPLPRLEPGAPDLRTLTLDRLDRLAGVLGRRGLATSLVAPAYRVPRLLVTHPGGGSEEVYTGRCLDRSWWYWWPWAERIAPETSLDRAARVIEQQLTRSREALR
jgi:hypothetical protein